MGRRDGELVAPAQRGLGRQLTIDPRRNRGEGPVPGFLASRTKLLSAALGLASIALAPATGAAQTELGVELGLYSSYVWRGISYTNKPVAQPDIYLTVPAGNASLTFGGWGNVDLGRYDDAEDDLSEAGWAGAEPRGGGRTERRARHPGRPDR